MLRLRLIQKYRQEKIVPISREEVWNILSSTNHLNQVLGLFAVEYGQIISGKKGVYRKTFTTLFGAYKLQWKEYPFQWNRGNHYNNLREYSNGPIKSMLTIVELYDDDQMLQDGSKGTRIVVGADVMSMNIIGDILIPTLVDKMIKKFFTYTLEYLKLKLEGKLHPVPQNKAVYKVNIAELDRILAELKQSAVKSEILAMFREHLLHQGDDEVTDMRPYVWAAIWGCDRDEILRAFLYMTTAGILNLAWHLICPNCRVSKSKSSTLSGVADAFHCDFCGIMYENSLDKYMELCFSVNPLIRKAYKPVFCIGGPSISPHVYLQSFVRVGEPVELTIPEHIHNFRLRVLQANHSISCTVSSSDTSTNIAPDNTLGNDQSTPIVLRYDRQGWPVNEINITELKRTFIIHNNTDADIVIVFEKAEWDDVAVTAAKVSTMNEFRRMFSSEILAPGHEVGIENITFFFSDLRGSTIFYEHVGDAHAYGQVRKHFDFITEWIHKNRGSIVKTIGDAVMAVFEKPEDGIRAALDIQANVQWFNASMDDVGEQPIVIKIGVHHGPAIAVNSNSHFDYFGRNVNIAARTQGLSQGDDIIISSTCMYSAEVTQLLASRPVTIDKFETTLRGIEEQQIFYQIKLRRD